MGKEEISHGADKRQYLLIGYVGVAVVMVVMTLVLAFSSEDQTSAQVTPTNTRNPVILTAQADYSTVTPAATRNGS